MSSPTEQAKKTIRRLREERGWAQLDVAVRLGVNQGVVSKWERGLAVPQRGRQQALAQIFGISADAIAFGAGEEQG